MIIIGSKALLFQFNRQDDERYNKSDFDVIMTPAEFSEWHKGNRDHIKSLLPKSMNKYKAIVEINGFRKQYEIELGTGGTSSHFLLNHVDEVCDGELSGVFGEKYAVLNLVYQMLTKRSHLTYPVHFEKNMDDYQLLKAYLGDIQRDHLMGEYYDLRSNEAKNRYKQKTPKLNVTTEDFFSSKLPVEAYFVHDDLHELMAHHDRPVYTMMQKDASKAWCEKDMFFELPYEYRVQAVQEEAYVIALERYIIPQHGDYCKDSFECYKSALKRICTTLTSGWFRDFAIENYQEAVSRYDSEFVNKFKEAYLTELIQPKEEFRSVEIPLLAS